MAQAIVVSGVYFTLNGQQFNRTYLPLRVGASNIAIYSLFDNRLQLIPATPYTEFTVGGVGFASQELAMVGLNAALYANPADGLVGGGGSNLLFDTRIAAHLQTANGSSTYANMGAMGMQTMLNADGEAAHIHYAGTVEYSSGSPILFIGGFSVNFMTADLSLASVGIHNWSVDVDIMRISSSSIKYSSVFVMDDIVQNEGGIKTALDFDAIHSVAITWGSPPPVNDEFELYFGYVNKLS